MDGQHGQQVPDAHVDRQSGTVIAVNAADRNFTAPGVDEQNIAMFRKIAEAE